MSSTIDVSVILPCYNVEAFLDQALSSAEQNDRINLEIIAVNDGSKDGSLEIMRRHAVADDRVRVIDKPNQGYGATMNRGIAEARGTYIAILEPDDWVEPHMYDDMFEFGMSFELPTAPDIIKTPYTRVWMPQTEHEKLYNCSYYKRVNPGFQPFTLKDSPRLIQHHPSIWSAIYRKDFLTEHHIAFKEVPGAGWVDNPFLIETLVQAKTIVYLEKPYYNYREDLPSSSSATRTNLLPFERWNDMADVLDRLNIQDDGIRNSFGVIGFRYAGGIVAAGVDEPEVTEELHAMFSRMGADRIKQIPNVDPAFKQFALDLIGAPQEKLPTLDYRMALLREFFYTWRTNGLGFSFTRLKIYLSRKGLIKYEDDPTKTKSASI